MLGNSSSSSDSVLPSHHFFANSSVPVSLYCYIYEPASYIFTTFNITFVLLLLPLCIFILHHGLQLWWQKKRSAPSAVTASHSDIFTYHLVVMELVGVCGCVVSCCGLYREDLIQLSQGVFIFYFNWYGETFFHVLTCVERYLAVIHPVTYLSLRNQRWIRIRNIIIGCVWLLCFSWVIVLMTMKDYIFMNFCFSVLSVIVISFCSLSVLCILTRPGPGEQGGGRERVDQSKQRVFYTIMLILGVLVLRFVWGFIFSVLYISSRNSSCAMVLCHYWFNLPCSLVLPLLFLHRAGKLVCWKKN